MLIAKEEALPEVVPAVAEAGPVQDGQPVHFLGNRPEAEQYSNSLASSPRLADSLCPETTTCMGISHRSEEREGDLACDFQNICRNDGGLRADEAMIDDESSGWSEAATPTPLLGSD